MSGGSLDYFYFKMEEVRGLIRESGHTEFEGLLKILFESLEKIMHGLEWWYSGDYSESGFIKVCLKESASMEKTMSEWKREADIFLRMVSDLVEKGE